MLFDVTIYYLWAVGSDPSGLRLAAGFAGVQSFPVLSRFQQFGVVSAPSTVHSLFVPAEK